MRVGSYEIQGELGRGGAAAVFRARGPDGRPVALKRLFRRDSATLARFDRERRLLGELGVNEGFVPLLDSGASSEGAFLVMPLLGGGTLRDRLARGRLPLDEALALAVTLARAMGRAHARGIIHRDLKPENVLYADDGRPLVADLGLAKHFLADAPGAGQSVSVSLAGELRGTVGYMAPEQARDSKSAGPAADVFALGAIVYECVTGRPAFEGESVLALLAKVEEAAVAPPRGLCPELDPRVEAVLLRALAAEPGERFPGGEAFAAALEEALRPAPRRDRRAGALALALVVLVVAGSLALLRRSREPSPAAPPAPSTDVPPPPPRSATLEEELSRGFQRTRRTRLVAVHGQYAWRHGGEVFAVVALDDRTAASVAKDGVLRTWDLETGRELRAIVAHEQSANGLARRPGFPSQLVTGGHDRAVRLWDVTTGRLLREFRETGIVQSVAVAPSGRRAAAGRSDGRVVLLDLETGEKGAELVAHRKNVLSVAWLPDGRLVTSGDDATAKLWDAGPGTPSLERTFAGHEPTIWTVAVANDARRIFTASLDAAIGVFDVETGERLAALVAHDKPAYSVAASSDGRWLASGAKDRRIVLWDARTLARERTIERAQNAAILSLAFTPDAKKVVTGSIDRTLGVFDRETGEDRRVLAGHTGIAGLAVTAGAMLTTGWDGCFIVRDAVNVMTSASQRGFWGRCVAASPDGRRGACAASNGSIVVYDLETKVQVGTLQHAGDVLGLAFSLDGTRAFSAGRDRRVVTWDLERFETVRAFPLLVEPRAATFSHDLARVLTGGADKAAHLVNLATGDEVFALRGHEAGVGATAFAPDDRSALTGADDGSLVLWNLETGTAERTTTPHEGAVTAIAFAPDGRRYATAGLDRTIRLFDTSGREVDTIDLATSTDSASVLAWSKDGRTLHAGTARGVVLDFEVDL